MKTTTEQSTDGADEEALLGFKGAAVGHVKG